MEYKTSQAVRDANKRYRAKNKETEKIKSYRRTARMYIKTYATQEDMDLFNEIFKERELEKIIDK